MIRRSGARDLPPSADHVRSQITVASTAPRPGTALTVMAPCGVRLCVRVREAEMVDKEWIGWADVMPGKEKDLLSAGVPAEMKSVPMRIFSWQVCKQENM